MSQARPERAPQDSGLTYLQQVKDEKRLDRLGRALDVFATGQYERWDEFFRMPRFDSSGNWFPVIIASPNISLLKAGGEGEVRLKLPTLMFKKKRSFL